jgi:DNA ligase-associated metallophosphoesterase
LAQTIAVLDNDLQLLPEKAVYSDRHQALIVADLHLGKAETFQRAGIPITNQVNQDTLERLQQLCDRFSPAQLIILGDLFHSCQALTDEVLTLWKTFLATIHSTYQTMTHLVIGNHDQQLVQMVSQQEAQWVEECHLGQLLLTHEPTCGQGWFNLCGHVHPCVRLQSRLDRLRLPCFYLDQPENLLILPSFGEFTGGFEVACKPGAIAYAIADSQVIAIPGSRRL